MDSSNDAQPTIVFSEGGTHGKGKTPISDQLAERAKDVVVALANKVANSRPGNQHPVSHLAELAHVEGIRDQVFTDALAAAVVAGQIEHSKDCGPKQMGVFTIRGR